MHDIKFSKPVHINMKPVLQLTLPSLKKNGRNENISLRGGGRLFVILKELVAKMFQVPCFVENLSILVILLLPVSTYVNHRRLLRFIVAMHT